MSIKQAYSKAYRSADVAGRARLLAGLLDYQAGRLSAVGLSALIGAVSDNRKSARECIRRADQWHAVSRARLARCQWFEADRAEGKRLAWIHRAFVAAGYGCRQGVRA